MKRILTRAAKSFTLPTQWTPVTVRVPSSPLADVEADFRNLPFNDSLTECAITNTSLRRCLCQTIYRANGKDLLLIAKKIRDLENQRSLSIDRHNQNQTQEERSAGKENCHHHTHADGLREIWTCIMERVTRLSETSPRHGLNASLYPKYPPHWSTTNPSHMGIPEIHPKKAVYFLYFLSHAAQCMNSTTIMQTMSLLLASVTASSTCLTNDEVLTLVKSVNRLVQRIDDAKTIDPMNGEVKVQSGVTSSKFMRPYDDGLGQPLTSDALMVMQEREFQRSRAQIATVSLRTLVEGVVRQCAHHVVSSVSIAQGVALGMELALLDIYIPQLSNRLRDVVTTCGIVSTDTDTILSIGELWKLQGVGDRDMAIFHHVAAEMMNNRIESSATPRQICEFMYQFGSAKILYPFVFDRCFWSLLRMTPTEKAHLDAIVNRMHGRSVGSEGTWHSTPLPQSPNDGPLRMQIGAWDSRIFVGAKYQLICRQDAEASEWEFWNRLLRDQLSMNPSDTLQRYPNATISNIVYPLFAMQQFERAADTSQATDSFTTTAVTTSPQAQDPYESLKHTNDSTLSFGHVVAQTLEGLNAVYYYDELFMRPLGQLLAMSVRTRRRKTQTRIKCQRRSIKHSSHMTKSAVTEVSKDNHDASSCLVHLTGQSLVDSWGIPATLTVFTALTNSKVRVPLGAITAVTQQLFPHLSSLDGQQLSQLMESIAQSCRGVYPGYFTYPDDGETTHQRPMSLCTLHGEQLWGMSPHALACWIINLSTHAPPTVVTPRNQFSPSARPDDMTCTPTESKVVGWAVGQSFQTAVEALAQKLFICYQLHAGGNVSDLHLVAHQIGDGFSWAGEEIYRVEDRPNHLNSSHSQKHNLLPIMPSIPSSITKAAESQINIQENASLVDELSPGVQSSENRWYNRLSRHNNNSLQHSVSQQAESLKWKSSERTGSQTPHYKSLTGHYGNDGSPHSVKSESSQPLTTETTWSHHDKHHHGDDTLNYDLKVQRTPGLLLAHSDIANRGLHDPMKHYAYETSERLFRVAWTAILSYGLVADVWTVIAASQQPPIVEQQADEDESLSYRSNDTTATHVSSIRVLDLEAGLKSKLESLPLLTVALIHDILVLCEARLQQEANNWHRQASETPGMAKDELERNPKLRKQIIKHLLHYGYEGVEPFHLDHPEILRAIDANVKQNRLPLIPDRLKRVIDEASKFFEFHFQDKAKDKISSAAVAGDNAIGTDDLFSVDALDANTKGMSIAERQSPRDIHHRINSLHSDGVGTRQHDKHHPFQTIAMTHRMSHYQNLVYRGLGLISRRVHRFLGCRRWKNILDNSLTSSNQKDSKLQQHQQQHGFMDTVSIRPNVLIGPLQVDLMVERISKETTESWTQPKIIPQ